MKPDVLRFAAFAGPLLGMCLAAPLHAQEPVPAAATCRASALVVQGVHDHGTDYARLVELAGAAPLGTWMIIRPADQRRTVHCRTAADTPWGARLGTSVAPDGPRLEVLPLGMAVAYNSDYPSSRNNGALWAGRGASFGFHGGVHGEWGPLHVTLAPTAWYQQNRPFEIRDLGSSNHSPFAYDVNIDWPQRHGSKAFGTIEPGQSQISLRAYGFAVGASTENMWWGPARRNPLLLSNSAPGIPRAFIGTSRPHDIYIGKLEAHAFWGVVSESDYFDMTSENNRNLIANVLLAYQPRGLPGLSLGVARAYLNPLPKEDRDLFDLLLRPYRDMRGNPSTGELIDNNLMAFYGRWAFPEAGFEAYVEWGREDGWADWLDIVSEPDHSQGYVLGFQKLVPAGERWVRVAGELTKLGGGAVFRGGRFDGAWYRNTSVRQGYTHRGQLLGAGIGPSSDAQFLGVDVFHDAGRLGAFVERVRYDEDGYYRRFARVYGMHGHDVELTGGVNQVLLLGDIDVSWQLGYSWRRNRNFVGLIGFGHWDLRVDRNLTGQVGVVWRPRAEFGLR